MALIDLRIIEKKDLNEEYTRIYSVSSGRVYSFPTEKDLVLNEKLEVQWNRFIHNEISTNNTVEISNILNELSSKYFKSKSIKECCYGYTIWCSNLFEDPSNPDVTHWTVKVSFSKPEVEGLYLAKVGNQYQLQVSVYGLIGTRPENFNFSTGRFIDKFDIDFNQSLQVIKADNELFKPIDTRSKAFSSLIGKRVEITQPNSKWVVELTVSNITDISEWKDFQSAK